MKAAVYLRSSKDRHDVSIDSQRQELQKLAASRKLTIVREYVDVVESAKDEHRPAFQELRTDLKASNRVWDVVLLLEPSRLSRNQFVAHWFTHDAKQHGASIVYARMPESNPMVDMLVLPLMHGFAEYHSWESKQKGLAGMTQNVQRGFRAGGRAPYGYRLKANPTGIVRDGQDVTKTTLEPTRELSGIGDYLKARATGLPRKTAKRQAALTLPDSTLIGIEWNALTYSGATVWNVHAERVRGKSVGGVKRRPRSEWVIKEGTHEAVISREEAEVILRRLEVKAQSRDRAPEDYLLGGMLFAPDGRPWYGCRDRGVRYYRLDRRVNAEAVEQAVIKKLAEDLRSPKFLKALVAAARKLAQPDAELKAIERAYGEIEALDRKIATVTALLPEGPMRPLMEQIQKWEMERERIKAGIIDDETRLAHARAISGITEAAVLQTLNEILQDLGSLDPKELRDWLRGRIERITMDPESLSSRIHYAIPAKSGGRLASPREPGIIPAIRATTWLRIPQRKP